MAGPVPAPVHPNLRVLRRGDVIRFRGRLRTVVGVYRTSISFVRVRRKRLAVCAVAYAETTITEREQGFEVVLRGAEIPPCRSCHGEP